MATSRRREVVDYIVSNLKEIAGQQTSFFFVLSEGDEFLLTEDDSFIITETGLGGYQYNNIYQNVFKGIRFIDQINDFPSIYIQAGVESYSYESKGNTVASLELMLRVYTYEENSLHKLEDLVEDIVRQVERINYSQANRIITCRVVSVDTDAGLLDPYGLGEIRIQVEYDVED